MDGPLPEIKNEETTALQVKGFEGELKQVLDKAVSLSSHFDDTASQK